MTKYPSATIRLPGIGIAGRKEALLMDRMPFYLVVFQSLPETAILISLGLILIGFKPKLKSVLIIASLESLVSFLVRSLPLPPGVNVFIEILKIEQGCGLPVLAGMLCQAFTLTPWGYRFIRWVDGMLSFRGQGSDNDGFEGPNSR